MFSMRMRARSISHMRHTQPPAEPQRSTPTSWVERNLALLTTPYTCFDASLRASSCLSCFGDVQLLGPRSSCRVASCNPLVNSRVMGKDSTGLRLHMVPLSLSLALRAMQQFPTASLATVSNRPTRRPFLNNQASSRRCHMSTAFPVRCSSRSNPSSSRSRASSCPSPLCLHNRIQGSTTAYPLATSQHSSSLQPCPRYVACWAREPCAVPAPRQPTACFAKQTATCENVVRITTPGLFCCTVLPWGSLQA